MTKKEVLEKIAFGLPIPAWGGQHKNFGDKDSEFSGEFGYNYGLGFIPNLYVGAKHKKSGLMGGVGNMGLTVGISGKKYQEEFGPGDGPRSLYKYLKDGGKPKESKKKLKK